MLNLKAIRNAKGISQQQLANKLGISRSTVAMWETGNSEPDLETLGKLAEYFDVTVDHLLGRDAPEGRHIDDDGVSDYLDELRKRPEIKTLFEVTRKATKEDVETAITIIEALKKKGEPQDEE